MLIYVHSFRFAISEKELYKVYVNLIELLKIKNIYKSIHQHCRKSLWALLWHSREKPKPSAGNPIIIRLTAKLCHKH